MEEKELEESFTSAYNKKFRSLEKRIVSVVQTVEDEKKIKLSDLNLSEIKTLSNTILEIETKKLHDELKDLLEQEEKIKIILEKKSHELQDAKSAVFNTLEAVVDKEDTKTIANIHQAKLQMVDLFDMLEDTVESAIITALEKSKDSEANEVIEEVIKELTYQTIKEGTLNTIRVRKILSTILVSAINIAEATPNTSKEILESTLRGMRSGLLHSIDRFKKRLEHIPVEAKHILIEDYDTIMEDLNQTDTLFLQVVQTQADESSSSCRRTLLELNQKMHYDLQELVHMSRETAIVMKNRFSNFAKTAVKKADIALKSDTAKEAKKRGVQVWGIAKTALGSAIKSAKDAIEQKNK